MQVSVQWTVNSLIHKLLQSIIRRSRAEPSTSNHPFIIAQQPEINASNCTRNMNFSSNLFAHFCVQGADIWRLSDDDDDDDDHDDDDDDDDHFIVLYANSNAQNYYLFFF